MTKRTFVLSTVLIALMAGLALAAPGSNYAGTWVLDKSKSELTGRSANIDSLTMVITQDDKQLTVDTKTVGQGGQAMPSQALSFRLDGSETKAEIGGRMPAKATLKAKWLDEKTLELHQDRAMSMGGNDFTVTVTEHWQLADGGKTLKIHRIIESPQGTQESKLVLNKS